MRHLAEVGALKPGLDPAKATDMVWTVLSPDAIHALVAGRGWTYDEVEVFLTDQLRAALLGQ